WPVMVERDREFAEAKRGPSIGAGAINSLPVASNHPASTNRFAAGHQVRKIGKDGQFLTDYKNAKAGIQGVFLAFACLQTGQMKCHDPRVRPRGAACPAAKWSDNWPCEHGDGRTTPGWNVMRPAAAVYLAAFVLTASLVSAAF